MTYTVADITELIHYHLVLGEHDDERADQNIAQLMRNIESMSTRPLFEPDGAGENPDGGFYCSECRFADEEA
jgi:hypothetical protein